LTRFGGRGRDGGNGGFDDRRWEEGSRDVLKDNVFSKIVSKVLVDEGVLGGCGKKVLFLVFMVLGLVGGNVGEDIKTINWGRGDGGAGDDIIGAVWDVKKREVLDVVKGGPDRSGR